MKLRAHVSAVVSPGNLTLMASRPSAAKKQPAKKAAAPAKAPAKKAAAKKAPARKAPAGKAPARKAVAKKSAPPKPVPSPTGGLYRVVRALWLGLAHAVGAVFRGIGQGAKNLDPAHRKDGVALLLLGIALIVAAGTWADLRGPVGDLVEILVTGAFGRLDLLVPILLAVIAVRFIRHPEKPEANGRIVIGLSALVVGVLGQVHVACGSPARSAGMQGIRDAGGLIGWAAATPLTYAQTVDSPGCRSSGAPPITTAGRESSSSRPGRGSSVRGSTTSTPSTRCSAHQRRYTAHSPDTSSTTWNSSPKWRSASTPWIPETSWRKKESTPSVAAGRASTNPTVAAPSPDSARAAVLGRQPSCSATRRTRARVASETPGRSLSAKDTALSDTPARRAMSFIVGRRAGDRLVGTFPPLRQGTAKALECQDPKAH